MASKLTDPVINDTPETELPATFKVVTLYEDFATGKIAKETYDYLERQLGRECQLVNNMWKFNVMQIAKCRDIAASDAMEADMIIISAHGDGELPAEVKLWAESWLDKERKQPTALVALIDRNSTPVQGTGKICSYLQEAARRGKLDFFAQCDDLPEEGQNSSPVELSERAERTSSVLENIIHHKNIIPWRRTVYGR